MNFNSFCVASCSILAVGCLSSSGGSGGSGGAFATGDGVGGEFSTPQDTDSSTASTDGTTPDANSTDAAATETASADTVTTPNDKTVAGCPDGQFSETPANPAGDIKSLVAAFTPASALTFIDQALGVRYPLGQFLLVEGAKTKMGGGKNCVDAFFQAAQGSTAAGALSQASTLVHECGHLYDIGKSGAARMYFINEKIQFLCTGLSYQGTNKSFARSLIKNDAYGAAWPACANFGMQGCDGYAPIYLNGNPSDTKFESGDQGYDMLLEEVTQYVNSLATDFAFASQSQFSTSAEDGILTFLWYMTRYLHMARLDYPSTYKYMSENECWRRATLTIWGRAWFYLQKTKGNAKLNLKGKMLRGLVDHPDLLDEIARLRQIEGCLVP